MNKGPQSSLKVGLRKPPKFSGFQKLSPGIHNSPGTNGTPQNPLPKSHPKLPLIAYPGKDPKAFGCWENKNHLNGLNWQSAKEFRKWLFRRRLELLADIANRPIAGRVCYFSRINHFFVFGFLEFLCFPRTRQTAFFFAGVLIPAQITGDFYTCKD